MSKLIKKIKETIKARLEKKMKKKAKKKIKKFFRKLLCAAIAAFAVVVVVHYRRPIIAALIGKDTPAKKCHIKKPAERSFSFSRFFRKFCKHRRYRLSGVFGNTNTDVRLPFDFLFSVFLLLPPAGWCRVSHLEQKCIRLWQQLIKHVDRIGDHIAAVRSILFSTAYEVAYHSGSCDDPDLILNGTQDTLIPGSEIQRQAFVPERPGCFLGNAEEPSG